VCASVDVCVSVCSSDFVFSSGKNSCGWGKKKILPPFTAVKLKNREIKQSEATEFISGDRTGTF